MRISGSNPYRGFDQRPDEHALQQSGKDGKRQQPGHGQDQQGGQRRDSSASDQVDVHPVDAAKVAGASGIKSPVVAHVAPPAKPTQSPGKSLDLSA